MNWKGLNFPALFLLDLHIWLHWPPDSMLDKTGTSVDKKSNDFRKSLFSFWFFFFRFIQRQEHHISIKFKVASALINTCNWTTFSKGVEMKTFLMSIAFSNAVITKAHCNDLLCHKPNLLMPGNTFKETSMQPNLNTNKYFYNPNLSMSLIVLDI